MRDLHNNWHSQGELVGRRTFVVAISGPSGGTDMQHWFNNARARHPQGGPRMVAMVALRLPFYAFDDIVRSQARGRTPQHRWAETWLDRDGALQRSLGLAHDSGVPWAFVIGADGRVVASLHAAPNHPAAQQIWDALAGQP